ncbi:Concanavalin A-like lectin/glucanase, subgroup [Artemisia annua]|uniref:arginine--tRNA ligase n=1 Tax=Artemisia annua TaxID=35608 RepID=A0A2U1L6C1_ARTAN|nr:Concanavalin A-like lectin/glucanase, subgroup [Artemisia annua]
MSNPNKVFQKASRSLKGSKQGRSPRGSKAGRSPKGSKAGPSPRGSKAGRSPRFPNTRFQHKGLQGFLNQGSTKGIEKPLTLKDDSERQLGLHLLRFTEVLEEVCRVLAPHILCDYLCVLCDKFNTLYYADNGKVLHSGEESKVLLFEATRVLLEMGILCTQELSSSRPTMLDVAGDLDRLKRYLTGDTTTTFASSLGISSSTISIDD